MVIGIFHQTISQAHLGNVKVLPGFFLWWLPASPHVFLPRYFSGLHAVRSCYCKVALQPLRSRLILQRCAWWTIGHTACRKLFKFPSKQQTHWVSSLKLSGEDIYFVRLVALRFFPAQQRVYFQEEMCTMAAVVNTRMAADHSVCFVWSTLYLGI